MSERRETVEVNTMFYILFPSRNLQFINILGGERKTDAELNKLSIAFKESYCVGETKIGFRDTKAVKI